VIFAFMSRGVENGLRSVSYAAFKQRGQRPQRVTVKERRSGDDG
jgi:hypothetical protein